MIVGLACSREGESAYANGTPAGVAPNPGEVTPFRNCRSCTFQGGGLFFLNPLCAWEFLNHRTRPMEPGTWRRRRARTAVQKGHGPVYVRRRRENFGIWHPQGRTSALTSLDLQLFCLLGQNRKCAAPREIQFAGVGSHGKPVETSELLRVQIWSKISVLLLPEASWSHLPRGGQGCQEGGEARRRESH